MDAEEVRPEGIRAPIAAGHGRVFVGEVGGRLHIHDLHTGEVLPPIRANGHPTVTGDTLLLHGSGARLLNLPDLTRRKAGTKVGETWLSTPPTIVGQRGVRSPRSLRPLVERRHGGAEYPYRQAGVHRRRNAGVRHRMRPGPGPVHAADIVYTVTSEGMLHAVDATTGRRRWTLDLGESIKLRDLFFIDRLESREFVHEEEGLAVLPADSAVYVRAGAGITALR
ncbi:PQQ-binding-like beta-propeller repeat protein [Spirillospora sp. CA-255316]